MSKSTVNSTISKIKRRIDYDITDSDLDTLIIDTINDNLKVVKQWFIDAQLFDEISASGTVNTITNQQYKQLDQASIIGDATTWTGVAGDLLKVTIDGTTTDTINVAAATTVALVATAINAATGGTNASATSDGYLKIVSGTTGSTSSVTIADGTGGNAGEAARLFSVAASRTDTAIADLDQPISLREKVNDMVVQFIPVQDFFALYPDETISRATTADHWAWWNNRFYFGPAPSAVTPYYLEYIKLLSDVASGGSLPFEGKYDPLIIQMSIRDLSTWLDAQNSTAIQQANNRVEDMKRSLIVSAATNIGQNRQTLSRRLWGTPYFNPRMVK